MIDWDHFEAVEMRAGTIVRAEEFPAARKPAYRLWVDFGPEFGVKPSSAQLTRLYTPAQLVGRQVLAVTNFPPRRIVGFVSEVLVTGFVLDGGEVVLVQPDRPVPDGTRLA
jgi:tRNA-binding protein